MGSVKAMSRYPDEAHGDARGRVRGAALALALLCALALALCLPAGAALADEEEKTETPTVSLEVAEVDADGDSGWGGIADAEVGEWTPYRAVGTLPSDWDERDSCFYEFTITPDAALEIDEDSVVVTLLDEDGEEVADLSAQASITCEDGVLVVSFEDLVAAIAAVAGDSGDSDLGVLALSSADEVTSDCTVQVAYEARLLAEAAEAGSDGAAATYVYLEYSDEDAEDGIGRSVEDEADLLTWALSISKLDADAGEALAGAGFSIRNAEGLYVAADGTLSEEAVELACDEDGLLSIVGLDAGDYTVSEVAAPEGYAAVGDFTLTISSELGDEVELSASVEGEGVQVAGVDADSGLVSVEVSDELDSGADAGGEDAAEAEEAAAGTAAAASGSGDAGSGSSGDSGSDGSGSGLSSILSQTGDVLGPVIAALALAAAVAAGLLALRRRRAAPEGD